MMNILLRYGFMTDMLLRLLDQFRIGCEGVFLGVLDVHILSGLQLGRQPDLEGSWIYTLFD